MGLLKFHAIYLLLRCIPSEYGWAYHVAKSCTAQQKNIQTSAVWPVSDDQQTPCRCQTSASAPIPSAGSAPGQSIALVTIVHLPGTSKNPALKNAPIKINDLLSNLAEF
jgi:hypothetical protein